MEDGERDEFVLYCMNYEFKARNYKVDEILESVEA